MSSLILRSRFSSLLTRRQHRLLNSGIVSGPSKDPITACQTIISDHPPPQPPPQADHALSFSSNRSWSFVKYSLVGALTAAMLTMGYASYEISGEALLNCNGSVPAKIIEMYLDLPRPVEEQIQEPNSEKLLPDLHPMERHVFTLVLDLNETLVYSDWTRERGWQTFKRHGVDAFLEHLAQFYEVVVYSDQPNMYVDPVLERLDTKHCVRYRLSRAATKYQSGTHYRLLLVVVHLTSEKCWLLMKDVIFLRNLLDVLKSIKGGYKSRSSTVDSIEKKPKQKSSQDEGDNCVNSIGGQLDQLNYSSVQFLPFL